MSIYDLVKGCTREADLTMFFYEAEKLSANLDYSVNRVCQELRCYSYSMKQAYESTEDYIAQHTGIRLYKIVRFLCFDASLSYSNLDISKSVRGIRNFKKEVEKFFGLSLEKLLGMNSEERYEIFINRHHSNLVAHSFLAPTMMTVSTAVVLYTNGLLDSLQKVFLLSFYAICIYALSYIFSLIAKAKHWKCFRPSLINEEPYLFLMQILFLLSIFMIEPIGYKLILIFIAAFFLTFLGIKSFRELKEMMFVSAQEVLCIFKSIKNREKLTYGSALTIMSLILCISFVLIIFHPMGGVISGLVIGNVDLGIWLTKITGVTLYLTAAILIVVFSFKFDKYVPIKSLIIECKNDVVQLINILR